MPWRFDEHYKPIQRSSPPFEGRGRGRGTMKPVTNYAQTMLTMQAERYTKTIEGLPEGALNWRPGDETTNSVAQLVRHVFEGMPWLLRIAMGEMPQMDQDERLQRHLHSLRNDPATKDELLGAIQTAMAQKDDLLAMIDGLDLSEE